MIRLMSVLSECIPLGWASIQPFRRTVVAATAHLFPSNQTVLSNSYSISLPSQYRLRGYSHLSCGFPRLSRHESTSRLFNFPSSSISGHTFSLQRRQLSLSLPPQTSIDSKMMGLSRLIHDPAKRKRLLLGMKLAGIALFLLVGKFISNEVRIDRSLGPRPEDTDKIREIKQFVVAFNQEKGKGVGRKEYSFVQDKAFAYIDELRYLGGLAARRPFNTDLLFAKRGFLELSTCEDPKVQREALRFLNMLLKRPFDPTQPAANFLWLEEDLGNMLRNMSEVNDSIPVMQELATAYGLVLEKIFLFCLDAGAQISNDQKLRVRKRANEISKKLENNPAFAYQARNAEVIAKHLPTPSQPVSQTFKGVVEFIHPVSQASEAVSETIKGINELVDISKRQGMDITSFLTHELFSYEGWGKLREFIKKSPKLYEECEDALRRLENSWTDLKKDIPIYESVFLLRPCCMISGKDEEVIEAIAESVRIVRQRSDSDWVSLYRLVEMLAEVAMSSRSYDVRKTAYDEVIACITPDTPWPVLYKIAITLFSMKSDPLFKKSVEDVLSEAQALFQSTAEQRRGLRWFNNLNRQMEDIDQAILSRYSFQPDPHSKMAEQLRRWVFKAQAFIPRKDVLEDIFSTFQEYRADTNQQVICGQGGVGKTISATSYVKEFGRDYRFVYWIDAHTFEEDWDKLAKARGIDPHLDRHQKRVRLKEYLETDENAGWLLIIDQVQNKDLDAWRSFIPRKGGHVLMTARCLDERDWVGVRQKKVSGFSPSEAAYYLLQSKRQTALIDNDDVRDIVSRLGCHPLALAQTRAYLERNPGISLKNFLSLYDEEKTRIFGLPGAKIGEGENESVHTIWSMNFKQLEEKHPKVAELFSFMSFLDSEEIPICLIEKWKEKNASEWGRIDTNQAMKTLLDYVLIDVKKEEVYSIHPLIRQVSTDRLDGEQKRKFLLQAVSVLWELANSVFKSDQTDKISSFEVFRPHCEAIIESAGEIKRYGSLKELYYLVTLVVMYHMYVSVDRILALDYLSYSRRMFNKFLGEVVIREGIASEVSVREDDFSFTGYDTCRIALKYSQETNEALLLCDFSDQIFEFFVSSEDLFNNISLENIDNLKEIMSNRLKTTTEGIKGLSIGSVFCGTLGSFTLGIFVCSPFVMTLIGYAFTKFITARLVDNIINEEEMLELIENIISGMKVICNQSVPKSSENYDAKFQNRITTDNLTSSEQKEVLKEVSDQKVAFEEICTLYIRANGYWFKLYKEGYNYRFLIHKDDYQTARGLLERALEIYDATPHRSVGLKQITARVCRELAWICASLGDLSSAIDHQRRSYEIIRNLHDCDAQRDVRRSLVALKEYQKMEENPKSVFSSSSPL